MHLAMIVAIWLAAWIPMAVYAALACAVAPLRGHAPLKRRS